MHYIKLNIETESHKEQNFSSGANQFFPDHGDICIKKKQAAGQAVSAGSTKGSRLRMEAPIISNHLEENGDLEWWKREAT